MRILYVWDADYPWDVRTEKVCLALTRAGHRVVIAARNLAGLPRVEVREEGRVERLPILPARFRRSLSFPAFFNPFWLAHLRGLVKRHRIDLVIVRDLPLAPTARWVAGRRPVILDMAENYPAMIRDIWTDGRQRPGDLLVRNPWLVAILERYVLRRVSHVITVVEESSDRLVALGLPPDRASVVSNTPPSARVGPSQAHRSELPLRLVYLGLMEGHRGIGTVLEACGLLREREVSFHLDLVGDGRDYAEFKAMTGKGLTEGWVTYHGRLPHAEAIAVIARAHVGLVPHEARESWNTTIPNKLFDYMAAGLVVITSDAAPAARVVRDTKAGLVFKSGDATELAGLISLCLDVTTRAAFSRAGQEAIRQRFNWERDTDALLQVLSRFSPLELQSPPAAPTAPGVVPPISRGPTRP